MELEEFDYEQIDKYKKANNKKIDAFLNGTKRGFRGVLYLDENAKSNIDRVLKQKRADFAKYPEF